MDQSLDSFSGNQLHHSQVVHDWLGLKCQCGISKAFPDCAREVGVLSDRAGWPRSKLPNWNLKPGSPPTETNDGSSAMTDPWADNEGEGAECHANSEGERGAWSVESGGRRGA